MIDGGVVYGAAVTGRKFAGAGLGYAFDGVFGGTVLLTVLSRASRFQRVLAMD